MASGTETSLLELAHALLGAMGAPDLEIEHGPERAVNGVTRRLAETSRSARVLGFEARIDLAEGLRGLVEWWRKEQAESEAAAPAEVAE